MPRYELAVIHLDGCGRLMSGVAAPLLGTIRTAKAGSPRPAGGQEEDKTWVTRPGPS